MQRLNKLLAHLGIASRRGADTVIAEGRITVNGQLVTDLGRLVDPVADDIRLDGERLATRRVSYRYLALNKPRGVLTTLKDPQGRPTVAQLLPPDQRVVPVGRLDLMSEGLLILTNDGDLANELTHPRHLHEKEYRVKISGSPLPEALQAWRQGMYLREEPDEASEAGERPVGRRGMAKAVQEPPATSTAPDSPPLRRPSSEGRRSQQARLRKTLPAIVKVESSTGSGTWLRFTLTEGRNRQVRRMIEPFKHQVHHLIRVRVGPIRLGNLKSGQWRELSDQEVAALKGDPEAMAQLEAAAAPRRASRPTYKEGWARPKAKAERPGARRTAERSLGREGAKASGGARASARPKAGAKPEAGAESKAGTRPASSTQPTSSTKPSGSAKPASSAKPKAGAKPRSEAASSPAAGPRKAASPAKPRAGSGRRGDGQGRSGSRAGR